MTSVPAEVGRVLMRLRVEMLIHLDRGENATDFCGRCHLPLPAGDFESYEFCPWCCQSISGFVPQVDESCRIIEHQWDLSTEIQCGECGGEYEQPTRYPFGYCPHCGARFAEYDELMVELPFLL